MLAESIIFMITIIIRGFLLILVFSYFKYLIELKGFHHIYLLTHSLTVFPDIFMICLLWDLDCQSLKTQTGNP